MSRWRIYYADGSTFDWQQGEPHEAPAWGFVCAVGYDQDGTRYIMQGWDYYRWDTDTRQWWGMDFTGLLDALSRNLVYACKIGRTVSKAQWDELMRSAHNDQDFPWHT